MNLKQLLKEWQDGDDEHQDLNVIEEGEWEQDHKTQSRETVFRHIPNGRFVSIIENRSGSYHTDWYYDDPEIYEVAPETKTITVYSIVRDPAPLPVPCPHTPG